MNATPYVICTFEAKEVQPEREKYANSHEREREKIHSLRDHPPRGADDSDEDDGREDTGAGAVAGGDGLERSERVAITCAIVSF